MNVQSTVCLIYGAVGAGKSTFARRLAVEKNAVRFAIDEWMHALYSQDKPAQLEWSWAMSRVQRCEAVIWECCKQILGTGRNVVLELGLLRTADRERWKVLVEDDGQRAAFYWVDADIQIRQQRVKQRNVDKGETYSFEVTQSMFDFVERIFEPPSQVEMLNLTRVQGGTDRGQ